MERPVSQENNLGKKVFAIMGARMQSDFGAYDSEFVGGLQKILKDTKTTEEEKNKAVENFYVQHGVGKWNSFDGFTDKEDKAQADMVVEAIKNGDELMIPVSFPTFHPLVTNQGLANTKESKGEVAPAGLRTEAAAELEKEFPGSTFFTMGGRERFKAGGDTVFDKAIHQKQYFEETYGINPDQVIPLSDKFTGPKAVTSAGDTAKILYTLKSNPAQFPPGTEVGVITNYWHSLRSWILFMNTFWEDSHPGQTWSIQDPALKKELAEKLLQEVKLLQGLGAESASEKMLDYPITQARQVVNEVMEKLVPAFPDVKYKVKAYEVEETLEKSGSANKDETNVPETRVTLMNEYIGCIKLILGLYFGQKDPVTLAKIEETINSL